MATKTPLPTAVIQRVMDGSRAILGMNSPEAVEAFSSGPLAPGQPIAPVLHDNDGEMMDARRFDYQVGWNLGTRPRMEQSRTRPFVWSTDDLRLFARSYGLLRIAIETKKNQIQALEWAVQPKGQTELPDDDARLVAARKLMAKPDGRRNFQDWQKTLTEETCVLDQLALRVDTSIDGQAIAFRPIDSGTLKLILDQDGDTPAAPLPAYTQVISGLPASQWTTDEMIFRVFNPAVDWPYGYSPVEQIADIVSMGIRRQAHQLNYYTEGNLPESIIVGPEKWDQKQTAKFQTYWDMLYEGPNALKLRRRTRFLPHGAQLVQAKEAILKDELDDWLARCICYAFNISPSALTKDNNRAVGETIADQNKREGLIPLMNWLKSIYDEILERAGYPDFEFRWVEEDSLDPLKKAQMDTLYYNMGAKTKNEVRRSIGLHPVEGGDEFKTDPAAAPPSSPGGDDEAGFLSLFGKHDGYSSSCSHNHRHSFAKAQKKSLGKWQP